MDETVLSFAISYIANQIPSVHSLLEKHNGLEARISNCYQKALAKWCSNETIRAKYEHMQNLQDLQSYILGKTIDEGTDIYPLVKLWAEELRNDKLCYDFILENKIDKVDVEVGKIGSKTDTILQMLESIKNNNYVDKKSVSTEFEKFLEEVDLLIEKLQVRTALSILDKLEQNTIIAQNEILSAKIKYRKGLACLYINSSDAYKSFHQAFQLDSGNIIYIESEIKALFNEGRYNDAIELSKHLPENNYIKLALFLYQSNSLEEDLKNILHKIENKPVFLQTVKEFLTHKQSAISYIKNLYQEKYFHRLDSLEFHNILEWIYHIEYYMVKLGSLIPIHKDALIDVDTYKEAADLTDKFQQLLSKTELDGRFRVVKLLDCFWGYIVDGNPNRVAEMQNISKEGLGTQTNLFLFMEAALLHMEQRTAEAFTIISAFNGNMNSEVMNFTLALGLHSGDIRYTEWALKLSAENNIKINNYASAILCEYVNKENAIKIHKLVKNLPFENEIVKTVLLGLCNSKIGTKPNLESIKLNIKQVPDSLLPYAAILLSEQNENSLAFEILNSHIDKSKYDSRQRIFINILSKSAEYYPQLYQILKENRQNGYTEDDNLLMAEYNMAFQLADYKNAMRAIKIVYDRNQNNEHVFVNYLNAIGSYDKEQLIEFQERALKFPYSSSKSVSYVYSVFIQAGYTDFAAIFLHNKAKSMDDEQLKRLFFSESSVGSIEKIVSKELEEVQEGVCVIYTRGSNRTSIIIDAATPLGKLMIGKRKNDTISFNGDEYILLAIYPYLHKLQFDYIQNVMDMGGNDFLRLIKINPDEDVLASLQAAVREFNPESDNFNKRQREALVNYALGEVPLSNFLNEDQIIGGYYKLLFGTFKIFITPSCYLEPIWNHGKKEDTRFVIDLPAIISLFEFSNKSGYKPNEKFLISNYLKEYINTQRQYHLNNRSYDFFEGISSGNILRFDGDIQKDINKRIDALIVWIENYCEPVIEENVLSVLGSQESMISLLFIHTMSLLLRKNTILISDDPFYSLKLQGRLPQISTEFFISKTSDFSKRYIEFLLNSGFVGLTTTTEQIMEQIANIEENKSNKFSYILQSAERNPYLLVPSIDAALRIFTSKAVVSSTLKMTITNLLSMCLKSLSPEYFKSIEWKKILYFLEMPFPNRYLVKECLLDAVKIVSPLQLM